MKRLACCLVLAATAARAAPPPPEPSWAVKVHLLSNDERVELRTAAGEAVCATPCDTLVWFRDGEAFKLEGSWLVSSHPLTFDPADTEVTLRVNAKNQTQRVVGFGIMAGGWAMAGGAAITLGFEGLGCWLNPSCSGISTSGPLTVGGIGLGVLALGAMIALGAPRTEVSREP